MPFSAFVEIYCQEQKPRLKESTWQTKENIIQQRILPYFENYKINEITTKDVRAWQNEMLAYRNEDNKPYSSSYLKTLHNQLSAILNYAVRLTSAPIPPQKPEIWVVKNARKCYFGRRKNIKSSPK